MSLSRLEMIALRAIMASLRLADHFRFSSSDQLFLQQRVFALVLFTSIKLIIMETPTQETQALVPDESQSSGSTSAEPSQNSLDSSGAIFSQKFFRFHSENGKRKRICTAEGCDKVFSITTSHTSLRNHWRSIHGHNETAKTIFTFSNSVQIDNLVKMFVMEHLEYSLVDSKHFQRWVKSINPDARIIRRHTLSSIINDKTSQLVDLVSSKLRLADSIALTFDNWSSRKSSRGFACLTGHYIDENWRLVSVLLEFGYMKYPHDAETLKTFIGDSLKRLKIEDKTIAITTDNASNNIAAVKLLKEDLDLDLNFEFEFIHFRCINHVIHLAVKDALKDLKPLVTKVREVVSFIRSSTKRSETFEWVQKEIIDQHEPNFSPRSPLKLIDEVDTRWNSTFLMLERALLLRVALIKTGALIPQIKFIQEIDWEELEEVSNFLKPLHEVTKALSGENYPTVSLVRSIIPKMMQNLDRFATNRLIQTSARSLMSKINEYSNQLNDGVPLFASILDPRIKLSATPASELDATKRLLKQIISTEGDSGEPVQTENPRSPSLLDDIFITESTDEISNYLESKRESGKCDPVMYWKLNSEAFPKLARIAKLLLPVQATSVSSERVFSIAGLIDTAKRNRLSSESLRSNMLLNSWLLFMKFA